MASSSSTSASGRPESAIIRCAATTPRSCSRATACPGSWRRPWLWARPDRGGRVCKEGRWSGPAGDPMLPAMTAIIQSGDGEHSVTLGDATLDVFTWHPGATPKQLLVVFHGMHADADNYRDRARPLAENLGAVVVAPKFAQP